MNTVRRATGCSITARQLEKKGKEFNIEDYGAVLGGNPVDSL